MGNVSPITCQCQVDSVKYNGRDYKIQRDRNGFTYIKVTQNGNRVIIPVNVVQEEDVLFNYVFNYGWRDSPNTKFDEVIKKNKFGGLK